MWVISVYGSPALTAGVKPTVPMIDTMVSCHYAPPMTMRKTMNVSITPELERSVADRVASGRYRTASEVVRAALRLLEKEEPEKPHPGPRPRQPKK